MIKFALLCFILLSVLTFLNYYNEREYPWEHTRALCGGNACRDYLITCLGDRAMGMRPISGFVVFDEGWKDRRENLDLC